MTRDEITQLYRKRIEEGARTRLYGEELEQLIQSFIDRLATLDSQSEIDELCRSEITLLEEGYPQATVGKNYIPRYRKAIAQATETGTLPLTENTLLDYDYKKRNGDTVHFRGHYAYTKFKYEDEYTQIAEADNARNNEKQDSLKPVQPDLYLEKARELLQSNNPSELAAGLAAVTGRRFSEVIQNKLEQTDHPYRLQFGGQLKKKEKPEDYFTVCLIPAAEVWEAIERFRAMARVQKLQQLPPQKINSSLNKDVQRKVHKAFGETEIVPVLEGETATTIHNLRAVYAVVAIHCFCPPTQADHRFLQQQLGHIISKRDLQRLQNSATTHHYFHYYLTDENGRHIGSKGVLLDEAGGLPELPEPEQPDSTEPVSAEPQAQTKPSQLTPPETRTAQSPQSEKSFMDALAQLNSSLGSTIDYLRNEAQEQKQRAAMLEAERDRLDAIVKHLRDEVATLKQENSDLRQQRDQASDLTPLHQQIEALQAENAEYRKLLEPIFRATGRTLEPAIDSTPATASTRPTPPEPKITEPSPEYLTIKAREDAERAKGRQEQPERKPRKTRKGSARGKLEGVVKFIKELNEQLDPTEQWALTQSLIGKLTGSNIKNTVKPFWQEIRASAEKYNADRSMDDRQNYGRDSRIAQLKEEFETWFDAQPSETDAGAGA